ncbi:MAG: SH3 domain-containing protein [Lachnospiraceae bacterium]|nr:SH3 domain-containing protein [Lachnospiraceae bacterium]
MKKRVIPVIIAILLILLIGGAVAGRYLLDRYSYSKERADLKEYYQVSGEHCAIVLQDEIIEKQVLVRDNVCYLDLPAVHKYLNEIFYVDREAQLLLYTTAEEIISTSFGASCYTTTGGEQATDYVICFVENDTVYVALEYIKLFTNFSYEKFEYCIQMYTEWGSRQTAEIAKDTAVRIRGGIKSPILRDLTAGEEVEILEQMDTWSKVKTSDAVIGYVENKRLINETTVAEVPVADYVAPEYTSIAMDGKVSLGFHAIGGTAGNSTLHEMVAGAKGMNVIAPTWFSLNDEEGNFRSFGEASYVEKAHEYGLQVWGVLDDFNFNNETGANLSVYNVLASTAKRQYLAKNITNAAIALGLDGINLDFERLGADSGPHFVQFLRELSILCRDNGLVLSIDNYVPFHFNDYYRLDVQGQVADYVIIMGYDEHWHGSGDPGSVASIDYVSGGIERTLEEVPASKVVNALPFYTILWRMEGAEVTDEYLTLNNTADFLSRTGISPVWEESTCQNYAEWTSGNATYKIWLEDAESISVKLNVMKTQNIGGVAVWRLGYGTPAIWELINIYLNS